MKEGLYLLILFCPLITWGLYEIKRLQILTEEYNGFMALYWDLVTSIVNIRYY